MQKKKKNGDEARKKAKSHEKKTFFETIRTGNQWCGGEGGKERGEGRERETHLQGIVYNVSIFIIPILHMRTSSLREVKEPA